MIPQSPSTYGVPNKMEGKNGKNSPFLKGILGL